MRAASAATDCWIPLVCCVASCRISPFFCSASCTRIACCATTAWPNSVSAPATTPAVTPSPIAGAALSGGAGRGPAAACAGEGRVGANLPPPLAGAGRGGGAAGGLCGAAAGGPPPPPPPRGGGRNRAPPPQRGGGGG